MAVADLGTGTYIGLAVLLVVIGILIFMAAFLFRGVTTERKFRQTHRENVLYLFQKGNVCQLNPDASADEQVELLPYNEEWEVNREQITLGMSLSRMVHIPCPSIFFGTYEILMKCVFFCRTTYRRPVYGYNSLGFILDMTNLNIT